MITDIAGERIYLPRTADDIRAIRQDCRTTHHWQEQLLTSLTLHGWNFSMLLWIPVADPQHWFALLSAELDYRRRQFDPSFESDNDGSMTAAARCGTDREAWLLLLLRTLTDRGWSRTMMSEALQIPRTNIIRRLDR